MDQDDLLASYEAAAHFTRKMLAAARASEWERFAVLEAACASEIQRAKVDDAREPLTPQQRNRKIEVIRYDSGQRQGNPSYHRVMDLRPLDDAWRHRGQLESFQDVRSCGNRLRRNDSLSWCHSTVWNWCRRAAVPSTTSSSDSARGLFSVRLYSRWPVDPGRSERAVRGWDVPR